MSVVSEIRALRKPPGGSRRWSGRGRVKHRDNRAAALFLAPWMIGLVAITAGPMLVSLYLSFTDYNLLSNANFTGLDNIRHMMNDERLAKSLTVTLVYVFVSTPIQLAAALGLAVVLDRGLRGLALYRSIFYLPSLLGSSVAVAVLWKRVFGVDGLVNQFLEVFGIHGPGWISSPSTALSTLILLHVWTFGAPMVIFLAGLRQVPREYYEAAAVDGASKWQQFRSITLPMISPIIFFNLVLGIIGAFQSFTQAFVVSDGRGGPSDSTLFFTLYLYQQGFVNFNMGYASALAWLLLLIIAAFTAINFWASKFWVYYDN